MNEEFIKGIEYTPIEEPDHSYISEPINPISDATTNFVVAISFGMFLLFLQYVLNNDSVYWNYLTDKISSTLCNGLNYYFYKENSLDNLEKENEEKTMEDETFAPPKLYENKYLEEVKKLADDIVFTETELETELKQRVIIRKNMENKLKSDKTHVETQLEYFEKRLEDLEVEKAYKKEDQEEEEKKEGIEQEIANIKNEQKLYKKAQELLEEKKIEEEDINKFAREFILKERLDNLKNCIVMEKTPVGNAIMFYNNSKTSFEYYSDSTLPYRYLEVIARKYILTYKCKQIFVDMEEEIKEAEKKLEEKKKKEEEEKQKEKEEKESGKSSTTTEKPAKNVFAKFKNYNKDNSIKVAAVPLDRPSTAKQTKPQEEKVIKERANRYSFEGKLANFNFLKKIDRKVVDKRYAVSFAEFKKMQKSQ